MHGCGMVAVSDDANAPPIPLRHKGGNGPSPKADIAARHEVIRQDLEKLRGKDWICRSRAVEWNLTRDTVGGYVDTVYAEMAAIALKNKPERKAQMLAAMEAHYSRTLDYEERAKHEGNLQAEGNALRLELAAHESFRKMDGLDEPEEHKLLTDYPNVFALRQQIETDVRAKLEPAPACDLSKPS